MRRLRSATSARLVVGALLLLGSALLLSSAARPIFTAQDKASYASPSAVAFVRPGLVLKILSVQIGTEWRRGSMMAAASAAPASFLRTLAGI